jgi:hypothetical protein
VTHNNCLDPKTGKPPAKPLHPPDKAHCPPLPSQGTALLGSVGASAAQSGNETQNGREEDTKPNPCLVLPPKTPPPGCPLPKLPLTTLGAPNLTVAKPNAATVDKGATANETKPAGGGRAAAGGGGGGGGGSSVGDAVNDALGNAGVDVPDPPKLPGLP